MALTQPFDPRAETRSLQVDDVLDYARRGRFRLPNFQRLLCWEAPQVLELFDSMVKGYPAGTFLLWERPAPAETVSLGPVRVEAKAEDTAWFVVDGQQRITTVVASLCKDTWSGEDARFSVAFDLDVGRFEIRESEFGPQHLPVGVVGDTVELLDWQSTLPNDNDRRRRVVTSNRIAKAIREFRFVAVILHGDDEQAVREVFQRTNQSGHPLGLADVLHALTWQPKSKTGFPRALDIERAARNVLLDARKDWVRDPYRMAEIRWIAANPSHPIIQKRIMDVGVRAALPVAVPKSFGGRRPGLVLDPIDRLVYQALVDSLSTELHSALPAWVYGYRLPQEKRARQVGRYAFNKTQWEKFTTHIARAARGTRRYMLTFDVAAFFDSVRPSLVEAVTVQAANVQVGYRGVARLNDMLRGWNRRMDRSGLPQRCLASAVIANRLLAPVDTLLQDWIAKDSGCARWMDDFVAWSADRGALFGLLESARLVLETLGLRMNESKTRLERADRLEAEFGARDLAAADYEARTGDLQKLGELTKRVLRKPESVTPIQAKFVFSRLGRQDMPFKPREWFEAFNRLPHAADSIAWLILRSGNYVAMGDWLKDYLESPWSSCAWSRAQLYAMYPAGAAPPPLRRRWGEQLRHGGLDPVEVPVVARHLALGGGARALLCSSAESAKDPFSQRWLVLAAIEAGATNAWASATLEQFEENELTSHLVRTEGGQLFISQIDARRPSSSGE